ncbi:copper amine oxidase N-terminal domain-containing protein [Pelotomaculum propionicicum]|uniref:copper amine oxidase N-terminal domain-containing protein n=1 Tax=Pelotomaculum propionicicum TaxID=258475 RepID=UPI003B7EED43
MFVVAMMVISIPWLHADAAEGESIKFYLDRSYYEVGSSRTDVDVAPYVNSANRTMVPLRFLGNALGVSDDNITWDSGSQTATLKQGGKTLEFMVDSFSYVADGQIKQMDTVPELTGGRVMLPARYVAEAFGYKVYWVQNAKAVMVTTKTLDTSKPMDVLLLEDLGGVPLRYNDGLDFWSTVAAGEDSSIMPVEFKNSSTETRITAFYDGTTHKEVDMPLIQKIVSVYVPDKADEINSLLQLGVNVFDDYKKTGEWNEWQQILNKRQKETRHPWGTSIYDSTSNGYRIIIFPSGTLPPDIQVSIIILNNT